MTIQGVLRIVVLVLSAGAMLLGVSVIAGILVPPNVPEQLRLMAGIVILLYGVYRFAVAYYRRGDNNR
jgi:hypothetical protein